MARKVWVVRHAERIDMIEPQWSLTAAEPYDPPLSPLGVKQARALAQRMASERVDHLFSSPFRRTLQTASAVAEQLDLSIKVEEGASENLMACWYTHDPRCWTLASRSQQFPRCDPAYRSMGSAHWPETAEACIERGGITMRKLVDHFPGNLMVVAHGASRSAMGWGLLQDTPEWNPHVCALVELTQQHPSGQWVVSSSGDISFLPS